MKTLLLTNVVLLSIALAFAPQLVGNNERRRIALLIGLVITSPVIALLLDFVLCDSSDKVFNSYLTGGQGIFFFQFLYLMIADVGLVRRCRSWERKK
jgi:hypothetical protein